MFRRRSPLPPLADRPLGPGALAAAGDLVSGLVDDGWVLPRGLSAEGSPRWTLVGTVASPTATPVDPAGLVVGDGWSLDWWIGGDDRWHLPAREAAVRQELVSDAPVVETRVRIPGGDAVARTYGIRSPRPVGDEWVIVEITNATPVPLALALVIRPFVADGVGEASEITIEPTEGGVGREQAQLVRVDGRPAILLPRRPARLAAGNRADGDAAVAVTNGDAGQGLVAATCPDGLATLALVFPLAHTATLRAALPVGQVGEAALAYPSVVPDASTVAAGWDVHRRTPRFEIPESRLAHALAAARAQVLLAHDGEAVRRDGDRTAELEPGATEVLLTALDLLDRPADVGVVLAGWAAQAGEVTPDAEAVQLRVLAQHWCLHRGDDLLEWALPEVAAAVERIDRADRKGALTNPAGRRRAVDALMAAADLLDRADQRGAAERVAVLASRVGTGLEAPRPVAPFDQLLAAARALGAGDAAGLTLLDAALAEASPTFTWPGPGARGRLTGQDLAAAAALVIAVRHLLVSERPDGLALLEVHPDGWYGGGIELHDAPTAAGKLSFAVRWHGTRPALLWELEAHPGRGSVRITVPGLDPTWSSTERRGEALLGEVAPPAGLEQVTVVSEHPDIDPEMRRPGRDPGPPGGSEPEGGSFS